MITFRTPRKEVDQMAQYVEPVIEIIAFESEDVITTSNPWETDRDN